MDEGAPRQQPVAAAAPDTSSSNVVVSSTPACPGNEVADGVVAPAPKTAFLADATIQQRVEVLAFELKAAGDPQLGTYSDANERAAVVVFPQEFTDYRALAGRLAPRVAPLRVILRAACYPHAKIDEAQRVIAALDWHPRAGRVPIAWHFDPSFSGYMVTVQDSAPEVATALTEKLGPLVRVRLGKPRPGGNEPK